MTHIVQVPYSTSFGPNKDTHYNQYILNGGGWQPGPAASPYTNGGLAFYVDGSRHLKPGAKKNDTTKSMNMLFVDGHVTPVSVREAYTAITGVVPLIP